MSPGAATDEARLPQRPSAISLLVLLTSGRNIGRVTTSFMGTRGLIKARMVSPHFYKSEKIVSLVTNMSSKSRVRSVRHHWWDGGEEFTRM